MRHLLCAINMQTQTENQNQTPSNPAATPQRELTNATSKQINKRAGQQLWQGGREGETESRGRGTH